MTFPVRALVCAGVLGLTGGLMVWGAVDFVKVAIQVGRGVTA